MAVNDIPSNVSYGTVTGRFLLAYADGVDEDLFPDGVPAKGIIYFTPLVDKLRNATATPAPVTIIPQRVQATLDSEGYLTGGDSTRGIRLIATDDPDMDPSTWQWRVEYKLTDQNDYPLRGLLAHNLSLPSQSEVDLVSINNVTS